jgi:transposase
MRVSTILNAIAKYKSFVYCSVKWSKRDNEKALLVRVEPRKNSKPICSGCGCKGRVHDRNKQPREFQFVPLWGIPVFFVYRMRRVDCSKCRAVIVEQVPWAEGKHPQTNELRWFLADWAKCLSWQETARRFRVSWDAVYRAVSFVVAWGLAQRDLSDVTALGVDEVSWRCGHEYLTLVYDISSDRKRLLAVEEHRTKDSLRSAFDTLGAKTLQGVKFVASDMWKNYLDVIVEKLPQAVHVLDRFHIMQKFGKALDVIRAAEVRELQQAGQKPVLKKTRYILLKRPENLTESQEVKLAELLKINLKSVRAYLMKEDFQQFWDYVSPYFAGLFLDSWTARAMRSRLDPLKDIARMLRSHRDLILNWFRARKEFSSGSVEALNGNVKLVTKRARGFRTIKAAKVALLHALGDLPTPKFIHRFCG